MEIKIIEQDNAAPHRIMTCACGEVYDDRYIFSDFECECRRKYNAFGQELDNWTGNGIEEYWSEEEKC